MTIKYHRSFIKNYKKRYSGDGKMLKKYENRVTIFMKDRTSPTLRDHQLKGKKLTMRAFSITGDVRVVYTEKDNVVYFLDIGTHNQVY